MVDDKEFFERGEPTSSTGVDIIPPELISKLKRQKGDFDILYAKLIANPFLAQNLMDEFRKTFTTTAATLIEFGIPIEVPKIPRGPEDVLRDSLAELGGMLGAKGYHAAIRMKKSFKDHLADGHDDLKIYRDPEDGSFYFIDPDSGEEIDCDESGEPLEE